MNIKAQNMKSGLRRIQVIFFAMAALLVGSLIINFMASVFSQQAREVVSNHDAIVEQLQETLSTMQDAETGQRGFLLSRDENYLEPYHQAMADVRKRIAGLESLAEEGRLSTESVGSITSDIQKKLDELSQTIDLARESGKSRAADPIFREGGGRRVMDSIRTRIGDLTLDQERLKETAQARSEFIGLAANLIFFAVAIINLAFLLWAFLRIRRHIADQYVANLETQRQKDILAVTLASIGDAVIITDTHARITYMNKVAEELTGWTTDEAFEHPCSEVFRIINETSREPVESPVEKVLEHGRIVGLANHTLLIRKDGSEVPIDDSGAPIREFDGAIRGVVLVFRDFSAHKDAEQTLIRARNEIEATSKAKDRFLATLSHELRTPLTPVLATLTALEESPDTSARVRSDVQLVRRNVELQARLIDDLLDLTRIEHGKLLLARQPVDAHAIVDSVASLFRKDCLSRNIRLAVNPAASRSYIDADPARIHQILWNLVGNAVKFSRDGGHIDIATQNEPDGRLGITVRDDGLGMSAETQARIFHRFEQGEISASRKSQGLGLGLSIARALSEAHGGELIAASDGEGKGSLFSCLLPTAEPPSSSTSPAAPSTVRRSLRILVLEDHEDTALVMRTVLRSMGHQIVLCGTVASALRQFSEASFDLILSDLGLPDGSGLEFIRQVRLSSNVPAIALTGYGMADDVEKCHQAGFSEHLTKPIDFEKLRSTVDRVVGP